MQRIASLATWIGGGAFIASTFFGVFTYTVDAGQRVIIFDKFSGKGIQKNVVGEGMHFLLPFLYQPIFFEVRTQVKTIQSLTGTKDLQTVDIALRLLYRPVQEYLPTIYQTIGHDYEKTVFNSIGNEVLKSVVAQYDADQLLKQREKISSEIKQGLIERARDFNLVLDDVALTHLSFMKEYALSIEQKQVAQQQAERQKFIVMRDEEEKLAQIIRSEGESEAARLISQSVQKFGSAQIELKKLEASKYIAETISKSGNIQFVPQSNGILLNVK